MAKIYGKDQFKANLKDDELAAELAARLEDGGRAVLSGLLTEQIEAVEAAYAQAGLVTETTDAIDEWAILTLKRA
jgi:ribosomal protein L11 methyltransferase